MCGSTLAEDNSMGEGAGELVSSLPLSLLTGVQWGWGAGRTTAALTLRQPGAAPLHSPLSAAFPPLSGGPCLILWAPAAQGCLGMAGWLP